MKKTTIILTALLLLVFAVGTGAETLTRQDQSIYGHKTFENEATFSDTATFEGAVIGINRYSTVFYVDSNTGHNSPGNYGTTYLKPFASIAYALTQANASKGDIIYVLPNHSEDLDAANDAISGATGVAVIGLGLGQNRGTVNWTAAAATWLVNTADFKIENLVLDMTGYASGVTAGIDVDAPGFILKNCEVIISDSLSGVSKAINAESANADRLRIANNFFNGYAGVSSGVSSAISFGSTQPQDVQITGNRIIGYFLQAPIYKTAAITDYFEYNNEITDAYVTSRTDNGNLPHREASDGRKGSFTVDVDFSSTAWNRYGYPCTHEIIDVTGLNRITILAEVESGVSDPASAGASGLIYVGYSGASDFLWLGTILNDLDTGEIWIYGAPGAAVVYDQETRLGAASGTTTASPFKTFISNDTDIGYALSGGTPTSGIIRFKVDYEPLEEGAYAKASSGTTL